MVNTHVPDLLLLLLWFPLPHLPISKKLVRFLSRMTCLELTKTD